MKRRIKKKAAKAPRDFVVHGEMEYRQQRAPYRRVTVPHNAVVELCWRDDNGAVKFWQIRPHDDIGSVGLGKDGQDAIDFAVNGHRVLSPTPQAVVSLADRLRVCRAELERHSQFDVSADPRRTTSAHWEIDGYDPNAVFALLEEAAAAMTDDDPAILSPLRTKFLQAHLKVLRDTHRPEEADYLQRLLFAPIPRWEDR